MPRVSPQDRLQPSLLDRLTDQDPTRKTESPQNRVLSMRQLRNCVLRDLEWLLNTGNLDAVEDLTHYPEIARSTLNYGVPHLAGTQASQVEARDMERRLREAIQRFEPRIIRDSVQVRLILDDHSMGPNTLIFAIEGSLWADPVPWQIYLKSEVDLEMGTVTLKEQPGREED